MPESRAACVVRTLERVAAFNPKNPATIELRAPHKKAMPVQVEIARFRKTKTSRKKETRIRKKETRITKVTKTRAKERNSRKRKTEKDEGG